MLTQRHTDSDTISLVDIQGLAVRPHGRNYQQAVTGNFEYVTVDQKYVKVHE